MKRYLLEVILTILSLLVTNDIMAIPAYSKPVRITQPDGSTLEIRIHGDEFLHWKTHNNRLIEQGPDGFYYYADFTFDGDIQISKTKVNPNGFGSLPLGDTQIVPPPAAIQRAMELRRQAHSQASQMILNPQNNPFTQGQHRLLCILVEFQDLKFTIPNTQTEFQNMMTEHGYSTNGAYGSVRDYFYDNSNGIFEPIFDVYGPVLVDKKYSYYGENIGGLDSRAKELAFDAVAAAIDQCNLDLTQYDNDGDGVLEPFYMYYAGLAENAGNPSDCIWPHQSVAYGEFQGIHLRKYACSSELLGNNGTEIDGILTTIHEFGHALGLPDFYDTDYDMNGSGQGPGSYSVMAGGGNLVIPPHLSFMERYLLRWCGEPIELKEEGEYQLEPIYNNVGYWTPTATENEFFLYEYRDQTGWDQKIMMPGVLIYHVDQSNNLINNTITANYLWNAWCINIFGDHQCYELEGLNPFPHYDKAYNTLYENFFNPGNGALDWNKNQTGYNLSNITEEGSFTLTKYEGIVIEGTVVSDINWGTQNAVVTCTPVGKNTSTSTLVGITKWDTYSLFAEPTRSLLEVQLEGQEFGSFSRYVSWIEGDKMHVTHNIILHGHFDRPKTILSKGKRAAANALTAGPKAYVGSFFSKDEMSMYLDCGIGDIEFSLVPDITLPEKLGVFVYDVTTQTFLVEEPLTILPENTNHSLVVNISNHNLIIETDHEYIFGYYFDGNTNETPILTDVGPQVPGGALMSTDGQNWTDLSTGNAIVSVRLSKSELKSDFPMIYIEQMPFSGKERFTLRLRRCDQQPESIEWTFDGESHKTGDIIEVPEGVHFVKAVLSFKDGSTLTLEQEILCIE